MNLNKINASMHALVLSCNDVIASCLIVELDEGGVRPVALTDISLPFWVKESRKKSPTGTPAIKRGDYLKLKVKIEPETWISATEEHISGLMEIFREIHDEDEELLFMVEEHNKKFWGEWEEIIRKDFQERRKIK
jgi:hypothetical protein